MNREEKLHFYLVLDNLERLLTHDPKKKIIEKLLLIQDMVRKENLDEDSFDLMRPLINLIFIHETYMNIGDLDQQTLLSNYNFIPFFLTPMSSANLHEVVISKITHIGSTLSDKQMADFLRIVISIFSPFTVNIREFIYLITVCLQF